MVRIGEQLGDGFTIVGLHAFEARIHFQASAAPRGSISPEPQRNY